ncbi:MAG: hypothetical protein ACOCUS_01880 [Polyangiales bacterium]
MKDVTREQRWMQWLAQAEGFAQAEQFVDAVARAERVKRDVQAELARTSDGGERERLERYARRVDRVLERIRKRRDEWYGTIKDKYANRLAHMEDQINQPLPKGLPG